MNEYISYVATAVIFYLFSYTYYFITSKGLGNKATFLQMRRYLPCAILAVFPAALVQMPLSSPAFVIPTFIALLWITIYPTLYWLDNHNVSSDFEFHFEAVFGMYLIAWITTITILFNQIPYISFLAVSLISIVEFFLLLIPCSLILYYALYKSCINETGMQLLQEAHYNEIIDFFKSIPLLYSILSLLLITTLSTSLIYANFTLIYTKFAHFNHLTNNLILLATFIFLTIYIWKVKKGVFVRTGIVRLYLAVNDYRKQNMLYSEHTTERLAKLHLSRLGQIPTKPHSFILVVGESASRDYMRVFNTDYKYDTTPWLSRQSKLENFILFPNSFSCADYTVGALSMAFTEYNQYNGGTFYNSCSIVDIAHKLGYKVHWYSNQGHLGAADTPVTLVAETADIAKWTKQKLNQIQYDEALIDYLDEINPDNNNFIVIHLKGSHFNFMNRYPERFTKFGLANKYNLEVSYANSIAYTDYILQSIFEYATQKLNLQAMLYFSDHATIPDKRRTPNYEGLGTVRIPLFVYLSDEYIGNNTDVFTNLKNNTQKYWSNDLLYELVCGIFNIESSNFNHENSLSSSHYKYNSNNIKVFGKSII